MRVKVLGCSGGIGGSLRTTAFLVDDDVLIDAGTGVGDLSLEQLARIDHVFVTHSHMDHIAMIPMMVDTVGAMRNKPLTIHATRETLRILKDHLFNWLLWPDFTQIPRNSTPFMRYQETHVGDTFVTDGRRITPVPANHTVPAVGYLLEGSEGAMIFSGDTASCDAFWQVANSTPNLKYVVIETAFPNKEHDVAVASKHLSPDMLANELSKLKVPCQILVTHLKPGEGALTMREVMTDAGRWRPRMLENNQEFML